MNEPKTGQIGAVRHELERWAERTPITAAAAMHVAHVLYYLRMAEGNHMPPCLMPVLARHVAAISKRD